LDFESVLITGGTGSFGTKLVQTLLQYYPNIKRLVIFSRDELKQYHMEQQFSIADHPSLRYFIGDVRDYRRLRQALDNIDIVIHAAALKQVPAAEYNPFEFIKTNVIGTQNLIEASLDAGVKRVVALSTDKAAAPINLYGATKLCADKLITAANNIRGTRDIRFSVVRYGNVMGSRGSVIPLFLQQRDQGFLTITDPGMTRFNISLEMGIDIVLSTVRNMNGGEIFVPRIPSYRITDLANAIAPDCEHKITGLRPGEKLHEEMITISDSNNTVDFGDYFAILPSYSSDAKEKYCLNHGCQLVDKNFRYASDTNDKFLTVSEIQQLIRTHVDPTF